MRSEGRVDLIESARVGMFPHSVLEKIPPSPASSSSSLSPFFEVRGRSGAFCIFRGEGWTG